MICQVLARLLLIIQPWTTLSGAHKFPAALAQPLELHTDFRGTAARRRRAGPAHAVAEEGDRPYLDVHVASQREATGPEQADLGGITWIHPALREPACITSRPHVLFQLQLSNRHQLSVQLEVVVSGPGLEWHGDVPHGLHDRRQNWHLQEMLGDEHLHAAHSGDRHHGYKQKRIQEGEVVGDNDNRPAGAAQVLPEIAQAICSDPNPKGQREQKPPTEARQH
mmetsp:Transcript_93313/g.301883  ORF Transcript_93313/g.301883 Transcript_93313/m.301883 type:complete len:223 (+) Transcript_93313:187-855(+)